VKISSRIVSYSANKFPILKRFDRHNEISLFIVTILLYRAKLGATSQKLGVKLHPLPQRRTGCWLAVTNDYKTHHTARRGYRRQSRSSVADAAASQPSALQQQQPTRIPSDANGASISEINVYAAHEMPTGHDNDVLGN